MGQWTGYRKHLRKNAVLAIALIFAIAASTLLADITLVLFEYQKLAGERS